MNIESAIEKLPLALLQAQALDSLPDSLPDRSQVHRVLSHVEQVYMNRSSERVNPAFSLTYAEINSARDYEPLLDYLEKTERMGFRDRRELADDLNCALDFCERVEWLHAGYLENKSIANKLHKPQYN